MSSSTIMMIVIIGEQKKKTKKRLNIEETNPFVCSSFHCYLVGRVHVLMSLQCGWEVGERVSVIVVICKFIPTNIFFLTMRIGQRCGATNVFLKSIALLPYINSILSCLLVFRVLIVKRKMRRTKWMMFLSFNYDDDHYQLITIESKHV